MRTAFIWFVFLALVSGCFVDVPDVDDAVFRCQNDEDCSSGYVCRQNVCQAESEPVGDSDNYFNNDCRSVGCPDLSQVCIENSDGSTRCEKGCVTNPAVCGSTAACVPVTGILPNKSVGMVSACVPCTGTCSVPDQCTFSAWGTEVPRFDPAKSRVSCQISCNGAPCNNGVCALGAVGQPEMCLLACDANCTPPQGTCTQVYDRSNNTVQACLRCESGCGFGQMCVADGGVAVYTNKNLRCVCDDQRCQIDSQDINAKCVDDGGTWVCPRACSSNLDCSSDNTKLCDKLSGNCLKACPNGPNDCANILNGVCTQRWDTSDNIASMCLKDPCLSQCSLDCLVGPLVGPSMCPNIGMGECGFTEGCWSRVAGTVCAWDGRLNGVGECLNECVIDSDCNFMGGICRFGLTVDLQSSVGMCLPKPDYMGCPQGSGIPVYLDDSYTTVGCAFGACASSADCMTGNGQGCVKTADRPLGECLVLQPDCAGCALPNECRMVEEYPSGQSHYVCVPVARWGETCDATTCSQGRCVFDPQGYRICRPDCSITSPAPCQPNESCVQLYEVGTGPSSFSGFANVCLPSDSRYRVEQTAYISTWLDVVTTPNAGTMAFATSLSGTPLYTEGLQIGGGEIVELLQFDTSSGPRFELWNLYLGAFNSFGGVGHIGFGEYGQMGTRLPRILVECPGSGVSWPCEDLGTPYLYSARVDPFNNFMLSATFKITRIPESSAIKFPRGAIGSGYVAALKALGTESNAPLSIRVARLIDDESHNFQYWAPNEIDLPVGIKIRELRVSEELVAWISEDQSQGTLKVEYARTKDLFQPAGSFFNVAQLSNFATGDNVYGLSLDRQWLAWVHKTGSQYWAEVIGSGDPYYMPTSPQISFEMANSAYGAIPSQPEYWPRLSLHRGYLGYTGLSAGGSNFVAVRELMSQFGSKERVYYGLSSDLRGLPLLVVTPTAGGATWAKAKIWSYWPDKKLRDTIFGDP